MTQRRAAGSNSSASGTDAAVRHLVDVFGRAYRLVRAGTSEWQDTIGPSLMIFYSLCRECDSTEQLHAVKDAHEKLRQDVTSCGPDKSAGALLRTCMLRIMLLAGLHSKVYSRLINNTTVSEDTYTFLYLLGLMLDYPSSLHCSLKLMPVPPLKKRDYETLGPLHWQPKVVALACRALASARDQCSWDAAAEYISSLFIPAGMLDAAFAANPDDWTEPAVRRKQYNAVLTDRPCMHAIWDLLRSKHFETMALGVHLMCAMVKEPLPAMLMQERHPHAMANLLSMGGAEPITHAMQASLSKLAQFQKEGRGILSPAQECWAELCAPDYVDAKLFMWVCHALTLDRYVCVVTEKSRADALCSYLWNEVGRNAVPAWPSDMLEAHVLCAMKDIQINNEEPRVAPAASFDFSLYPNSWLPGVASVLSRHAWTLNILVHHTEVIINVISLKLPQFEKAQYEKACRMVLKFVRSMLEAKGSHNLKRQLPCVRLIRCCTLAWRKCVEEIHELKTSGCKSDADQQREGFLYRIIEESLLLLKCILDLPAGQEVFAARAPPFLLEDVLLSCHSFGWFELPEPKITDATRARINARGQEAAQSTGGAGNSNSSNKSTSEMPSHQSKGTGSEGTQMRKGSPAQSSSAEGPSSSTNKSESGLPAPQSEGSRRKEEQQQGHVDGGRLEAHVSSSGEQGTGLAGAGKGASSSSGSSGLKVGAQGEDSRSKAVSGSPSSCAGQGASGSSERASMGEGAERSGVAEGEIEGVSATEQKVECLRLGEGAGNARGPERTCGVCGVMGKMRLCGGCKIVSYCSETCQRAAWPLHRKLCKPK